MNMRNMKRSDFFAVVVLTAAATMFVGKGISEKGGGGGAVRPMEFLFVSDGTPWNFQNLVGTQAQMKPFAETIGEASTIAANAREDAGVILELAQDLHAVMSQIEGDTLYFAFRMPFSTPEKTALNTAVDILKFRQNENDVEAWFWFSTVPNTNVVIHLSATTEFGDALVLAPIANEWPNATLVDGVPCYRYVYALPDEFAGVVLFPPQEIIFGGLDGQQFQVPSDGIAITDSASQAWTPFSGTDIFEDGLGNILAITYAGGIAVGATLNGEPLK